MPPDRREDYAGSVHCVAKTAEPDMSAFDAPEIVVRLKKHHHAGLIVRSSEPERVEHLLSLYSEHFARQFLATVPEAEKPAS
jgi:hypothetical protein